MKGVRGFQSVEARELQQKGVEARRENKERTNELVVKSITGGFVDYEEKLQKIRDGIELSAPEKEYMDRMERWTEFCIPKLARVDNNNNNSGSISIILQHNGDKDTK
jgi:hypothetical protein